MISVEGAGRSRVSKVDDCQSQTSSDASEHCRYVPLHSQFNQDRRDHDSANQLNPLYTDIFFYSISDHLFNGETNKEYYEDDSNTDHRVGIESPLVGKLTHRIDRTVCYAEWSHENDRKYCQSNNSQHVLPIIFLLKVVRFFCRKSRRECHEL